MPTFNVKAHLDHEAGVWWAESDDLPGLVAEAASHDDLVKELRQLVPELIEMNLPSLAGQQISFMLVSDQVESLCLA